MKRFEYTCPHCESQLSITQEYINQICFCPNCTKEIFIAAEELGMSETDVAIVKNLAKRYVCTFCTEEIIIFYNDLTHEIKCPFCKKEIPLDSLSDDAQKKLHLCKMKALELESALMELEKSQEELANAKKEFYVTIFQTLCAFAFLLFVFYVIMKY